MLDLYRRTDDLLSAARCEHAIDEQTVLFVLSDHGFKPFRRGVNLNAWLLRERLPGGKDAAADGRHATSSGVDWSRTRAYAFGLGGIYLNVKGREARRHRRAAGAESARSRPS